jgi:hypothetical protein
VILLNVEAVLSTDELSVLDELSRQGTPGTPAPAAPWQQRGGLKP